MWWPTDVNSLFNSVYGDIIWSSRCLTICSSYSGTPYLSNTLKSPKLCDIILKCESSLMFLEYLLQVHSSNLLLPCSFSCEIIVILKFLHCLSSTLETFNTCLSVIYKGQLPDNINNFPLVCGKHITDNTWLINDFCISVFTVFETWSILSDDIR